MLTVDELFALPTHYATVPAWKVDGMDEIGERKFDAACRRQEYFDFILAPRLSNETFGTDGGYVLVDGERVDVFAAVSDGIAHALFYGLTDDVEWRSEVFNSITACFSCPSDNTLDYDYLGHGWFIFFSPQPVNETPGARFWSRPGRGHAGIGAGESTPDTRYRFVDTHVVEKYIRTLERWVDVYAENKASMQHFPKLSAKDVFDRIITPLMHIPTIAFDGTIMRLVDKMLELGISWFHYSFDCDVPGPVQQNLLFLARNRGQKVFMRAVLRTSLETTDGGILAEAFLKSLVRAATLPLIYCTPGLAKVGGPGAIDFQETGLTICETMTILLDNSRRSVISHVALEELAHEALTVWLRAFENNIVKFFNHNYAEKNVNHVYILRQLVLTYYMQAWRTHKSLWSARQRAVCYLARKMSSAVGCLVRDWVLRFDEPDPELMQRARALMLSFDGSCWPEGTMPYPKLKCPFSIH